MKRMSMLRSNTIAHKTTTQNILAVSTPRVLPALRWAAALRPRAESVHARAALPGMLVRQQAGGRLLLRVLAGRS